MYGAKEKVFWFSVVSRLVVLLLQCIFNVVWPDHEADAFRTPLDPAERLTAADKLVEFLFGGLTRWDGQYFIHVAKYGYTYENTLAFYPLYPMTVRFVAVILRNILFVLNYRSVIILAAVSLNFACFVKCALVFHQLSLAVLKNPINAYRAAILFCVNPASIFFSAIYSESMFAYLTFYAMLESYRNNVYAYLPLGLSILARSNGLTNIGFPLYYGFANLFRLCLERVGGKSPTNFYRSAAKMLASMLNTSLLSLLPLVLFQLYNYVIFCVPKSDITGMPLHIVEYGWRNDLAVAGNGSVVWCEAKIPLAYSYVQDKYWDVGFMRYYQLKQIPNFLLALPVLSIMLTCVAQFFMQHKMLLLTLGLAECEKNPRKQKYPQDMLVFVIHGFFLTLFSIFFVHIQVSTRLLASASPLIYWFCALSLSDKSNDYEHAQNLSSKWKIFLFSGKRYYLKDRLIITYFLGYTVVGTFMFSNFLPWT